jgi:UDP-N-acetylmuramoyl-L-alanyl-D-glutamate--2,6-diaminopimelate ligase
MRLAQLLEGVPGIVDVPAGLEAEVSSITSDSRQVTPGALFVAYQGVGADGHRYIPDALARGAVSIVGERPVGDVTPSPGPDVPYVQVQDGRAALAWLHAAWHGHPSRSMTVVGVTGTDGKTTTCNLLFSILGASGVRAGMISTVNAVIGNRTYDTGLHTTTPDAADVQHYLAQMRDAGTEVVVLETTSHGLAQHRVTGVDYDVAVVTNITHEHLDFHGSYEAYRDAKAMLFRSLLGSRQSGGGGITSPLRHVARTAVLNADDSSFGYLARIPAEHFVVYTGRPANLEAPWDPGVPVTELRATAALQEPAGMSFDVEAVEHGEIATRLHLSTRLVGRFNMSNVLAAVGAALALGVGKPAIETGIAALQGVPGRMERIDRGQNFTAIVDFAHTPNALAAALATARDLVGPRRRVVAVFGSAGLRDRQKRRLMGQVAAEHADYTVITAEDPRTEDLAAILAETAEAMTLAGRVESIDFVRVPDRQAAILHAVRNAQAGDVVLVCGKGHEHSMCFGTVEHPWRDQEALAWALDVLLGKASSRPPFVLPTWPGQT